jgi:hypothetical protein
MVGGCEGTRGYGSEVSIELRRFGALCRTDIRYTDGGVSLVLVLV